MSFDPTKTQHVHYAINSRLNVKLPGSKPVSHFVAEEKAKKEGFSDNAKSPTTTGTL